MLVGSQTLQGIIPLPKSSRPSLQHSQVFSKGREEFGLVCFCLLCFGGLLLVVCLGFFFLTCLLGCVFLVVVCLVGWVFCLFVVVVCLLLFFFLGGGGAHANFLL